MAGFTPVDPPTQVSLTGVAQNTWLTGIASGAPAGSTGVLLLLETPGGGGFVREVRCGGSTDTFTADTYGGFVQRVIVRGCDSNAKIDYYSSNSSPGGTNEKLWLLGYFDSTCFKQYAGGNFASVGAFSATGMTSYAAPAAAVSGGAIGIVVNVHGGTDYNTYFRSGSTSTDTFQNSNESFGLRDWVVGLDGSNNFQATVGAVAGRTMYSPGYFVGGITFNITGVTRSPTAGSYQNVVTTGDTSPTGILYYLHSPSTQYTYQASKQGTSWTAPNLIPPGGYAGLAFAANAPQLNIQNAALVVSEVAYFKNTAAAPSGGQYGMLMGVGS